MPQTVITRFAPSPTGYLHIGGARTALFNWAFARANQGKFLLRIEDTDQARSTTKAVDAIEQGLNWLELTPDEAPVFQSKQQVRHSEIANQLLSAGHAYRSFASDEEIETIRQEARAAGVAARYPGRDEPIGADQEGSVIRFKAPLEGETLISDLVQKDVIIANDQLDDFVLMRADGSPTYMLAVVVDDHDMGITHVIRGDDHLTNCARQIQIYNALAWTLPQFAHIPLIHGADGAKLSKRHGALGAEQYQAMGYLAPAMRNYLARLGWSHGDDEIIPTDKLIEWFDLDGVNKAPARFDFDKLNHINGHYIRTLETNDLLGAISAMVGLDDFGKDNNDGVAPKLDFDQSLIDYDKLGAALPFLRERSKTLIELLNSARYLFVSVPLEIDEKAQKNLSAETAKPLLLDLHKQLQICSEWDKEALESLLKGFASDQGLKFGKIAPVLRSVLTGSTVSPGIYDVLYSLGKQESLKRIESFLKL